MRSGLPEYYLTAAMEMRHQENKVWLDGVTKETRNFRKRRSTLERFLLVLVVVLALVLVVVVVFLAIAKQSLNQKSVVCVSKECVEVAARINRYLDYSVPYCDNFYQFACGRWIKENVIPNDKSYVDSFSLLSDQVNVVLKNLLEEEVKPSDLGCVKKAKDLYKSCMDLETINSRGDKPLLRFMNEFRGWPLTTKNWPAHNFNLVQSITAINTHGFGSIISFGVGMDEKNSSRNVLQIDQPGFGMPGQKYYLVDRNETMLKAYEEFIYNVGQQLGFAYPASARREVADIVDFEISLAKISVPDEDRRDRNKMYNPTTLGELYGTYGKVFNWREYIHGVTSSKDIGLNDITDNEVIINRSPDYYKELHVLLSTTENRTLANYIMWRVVNKRILFLGDSYNNIILKYTKAITGASFEPDRFRMCASFSTFVLGFAVGRMFIKDNFDGDSKTIAMEMISELHSSFNELLGDLDWMDADTKKVAREKNDYIVSKVGYPDEVTNDAYLEKFYANLTIHNDLFFENGLLIQRNDFQRRMRMLRKVVDKMKWESPPTTVNAFYNSIKNQIIFPAGILQPPFFSKHFPKSINFAGIGVVIGHEITHGFDDRGRQYDKYGNLVQWWSPSAVEKFKDKADCLVQQYNHFTMLEGNLSLNGINTLGENIADNGGIKQAFKAYRNWVKKQGREEPLLPGLDFNHNQLFFINFAQIWCSMTTEENALQQIKIGVHSPGRFRVIGVTQNSPDFAKAFNCPINTYMNPEKKCSVW